MLNRKQYIMLKKILKGNETKPVKIRKTGNNAYETFVLELVYKEEYGSLDIFRTIPEYDFINTDIEVLRISNKHYELMEEYRKEIRDFWLFKVTQIIISLLAIGISIGALIVSMNALNK